MVDFFKKSGLSQLVAILLLTVALWVHPFIEPPVMEASPYSGVLYVWLCGLLGSLPRVAVAIGLLLTLAEAAWLNVLLVNNKLLPNNSFLPALCFILLSGFGCGSKALTEMSLVNFIIIYGAAQFMTGMQPILSRVKMCNAITSISLATLIYVPAIFLLVPFMVQFFVYRMYHWKDLVALLLGLLAPYILIFTVAFMSDATGSLWLQTGGRLQVKSLAIGGSGVLSTWLYIVALLPVLIATVKGITHTGEQTAVYKRNAGAYLLPLLASVPLVLYGGLWPLPLQAVAMPAAFAASVTLCNIRRRKWVADICLILFILSEFVVGFFETSFSGCGNVNQKVMNQKDMSTYEIKTRTANSKLPLLLLIENVPFHESFSGYGSVSKLPLLLLNENVEFV
ncbi:MAG: hypothetical protein IJU81_03710 [Bacteroidales bacterium]|nr:hypothetical protein [Bacteroidales bacterium]